MASCAVPLGSGLDAMAAWADQGKLQIFVQEQIPFSQIGRAYATNAGGHVFVRLVYLILGSRNGTLGLPSLTWLGVNLQ